MAAPSGFCSGKLRNDNAKHTDGQTWWRNGKSRLESSVWAMLHLK